MARDPYSGRYISQPDPYGTGRPDHNHTDNYTGYYDGSAFYDSTGDHHVIDHDDDPQARTPLHKRHLTRARHGKWIAGVLSGIGQTYGINTTLLRLGFLALTLLPGTQPILLIYLVAWLIIPAQD